MKKIIILLISILLTGCFDNIELDNLSIISGIGIDYIDNEYKITYEIINSNKSEVLSDKLSYTVNGYGKKLSDAFIDANYRVSKKPFFAHMKVLLISKDVSNNHLEGIIDYLFRDINIRDEFNIVICDNPEEILKHNSTIHPIVSNYIYDLLESEKYNHNTSINDTFKTIISKLISNKRDIILNNINIINDDINLDNAYIFNEYKSINSINKDMISIYNLLNKNNSKVILTKKYNDKDLIINLNNSDVSINITCNKIDIYIDSNAKILENNTTLDFKDNNTFKKINSDYNKILNTKIKSFIKYLQSNNSDILGFEEIFYKKYNKENKGLWKYAKVNVFSDIKINAKGFIFEVHNEK